MLEALTIERFEAEEFSFEPPCPQAERSMAEERRKISLDVFIVYFFLS